jgi:protein-disulfide isomerase
VAQARGGGANRRTIAVVIGVVLLAAAVIGGVLWTNASKNATHGQAITPQAIAQELPAQREGVVVSSGPPTAKATVDVYADFLCPICGQFQQAYGKQIEDKVRSGELRVRYHMVPLLVQRSDPPGYSLDAANAALCAADAGKFTSYHDSLFAQQPGEGKRGYDRSQLIKLGQDLGITGDGFPACVNGGTYNQALTDELAKAEKDSALQQDFGNGNKGFGTPTVVAGGRIVQVGDPNWLTELLAGKQG